MQATHTIAPPSREPRPAVIESQCLGHGVNTETFSSSQCHTTAQNNNVEYHERVLQHF